MCCNHTSFPGSVSGQERLGLLELCMLLTVQFGVDHPDLTATLRPLVTQLAQDPSLSAPERSEVSHPVLLAHSSASVRYVIV